MARPEKPPKTPLAERLREVRRKLGDPERAVLAERLGVPVSTLASWERGINVPDALALSIYREKLGTDLDWLLFGTGSPPLPAGAVPALDTKLLRRLGEMVGRIHAETGIAGPKGADFETAAALYNELLVLVPNPEETAADVIDAMVGVIEARFRRRVEEAVAEPGTGKRSAS